MIWDDMKWYEIIWDMMRLYDVKRCENIWEAYFKILDLTNLSKTCCNPWNRNWERSHAIFEHVVMTLRLVKDHEFCLASLGNVKQLLHVFPVFPNSPGKGARVQTATVQVEKKTIISTLNMRRFRRTSEVPLDFGRPWCASYRQKGEPHQAKGQG